MAFMQQLFAHEADDVRRIAALYRATGIETRYSCLPDFGGSGQLFDHRQAFPAIGRRMAVYRQEAPALAEAAVRTCLAQAQTGIQDISHLITVSCTGMYAPGLDIDLVHRLGLPLHTRRLCINFMGCYGAFNGLKVATDICKADPQARVLVVCAELCTLHFDRRQTEDDLLAFSLFGDGAAAALVVPDHAGTHGLGLDHFYATLLPKGAQDMAWQIGDQAFEMRLSAYVPRLLEGGLADLSQYLPQASTADFHAIHPGGKKILDAVRQALNLDAQAHRHAREVLRDYGNMSSPTILFVLQRFIQQFGPGDNGKSLLAMAFGPGLTLETGLFGVRS